MLLKSILGLNLACTFNLGFKGERMHDPGVRWYTLRLLRWCGELAGSELSEDTP